MKDDEEACWTQEPRVAVGGNEFPHPNHPESLSPEWQRIANDSVYHTEIAYLDSDSSGSTMWCLLPLLMTMEVAN